MPPAGHDGANDAEREGAVQENVIGHDADVALSRALLKDLLRELETKPMPGKLDFPNADEDEIVNQILERRALEMNMCE